jgi:anti-sigma factor RsiW
MMNCRELAELLIDFVSGDLPEEQRARIEQHLGRCPPCVTYLETYRLTIRLTRRLPCSPLPPELEHRLRMVVRGMCQDDPRHRKPGESGEAQV